jgi:hypothetical protein
MVARAAGAGGGPARQQNGAPALKKFYTVVVYEKKRIKTVVLYAGWETFVFKIPAYREVRGTVKKTWTAGNTKAYVMYVRAGELAKLIHAYAHEEAMRKISLLDPLFRAAVIYDGYKVHDNALYVELWLNHELGTPLFRVGDPRERELGNCLTHFTHSYGIWRMVTPPWATIRC